MSNSFLSITLGGLPGGLAVRRSLSDPDELIVALAPSVDLYLQRADAETLAAQMTALLAEEVRA